MSDKNDAAFDVMARQLATHIIRDPALLWQYQADVTQLIAHSEVAFAAALSDGTILLRCPNGLPEDLAAVAEPFKPLAGAGTPAAVDDKLALIESKLDGLMADQIEREQMLDRLDTLEFALQERLGTSEEDPTAAETAAMLNLLIQKQDSLSLAVSRKLEPELVAQAIANLEDRVMAALQTTSAPDFSPIITAVTEATVQMQAALAMPTLPVAALEDLLAKVEDLATRAAPATDLTAQHQAFTKFLISVGNATARLEEAIASLSKVQDQTQGGQTLDIASALKGIESLITEGPDLSPLFLRMEALQDSVVQGQKDGTIAEALSGLTAQIVKLAQRPDPVLDLTAQRQSFAAFGTALSKAIERLETVSEALAKPVEPTTATTQLVGVTGHLDRILSQGAMLDATVQTLAEEIMTLGQRPAPVLDLTAQRQSFAAFAQALSQVVTRLERVSDHLEPRETLPEAAPLVLQRLDRIESDLAAKSGDDRRDILVEALLQLTTQVPHHTPSPQTAEEEARMELFRVAQDELLQDMRFAFAELIAMQMRAQSLAA